MQHTPDFYIITGGPGSGKTTLIRALAQQGFTIVPEDARRIIKEQVAIGGNALPWNNKGRYAQLMLEAAEEAYENVTRRNSLKPVFFDRGILDTICYMKLEQLPIPEAFGELVQAHPYQHKVFILPPWPEIYTTDAERKQSWEEVVVTFEQMKVTYQEYGYEVVEVPTGDIKERCAFIINYTIGLTGDL